MSKKYNYFKNDNGKYECGYCSKDYKYASGARRHVKKHHKNERMQKSQNEKIEKEENGNKAKVRSKSHRIKTLDQLLEATDTDLDTWYVERHKVNKWEVGSKHPDTGEVVVEPLFQVKASLKRKTVKKQKFPVLKPVRIESNVKIEPQKEDKGLKTAVVLPDLQLGFLRDKETGELTPFHDRKCMDLSLKVIKEEQPDTVILLGDMLDLAEWSLKFQRKPSMFFTTQATLIELNWFLAQIRKIVPSAKIIYLEGNHEDRITRAIVENMKAAYQLKSADNVEGKPMLSIENMLGLESLGVEYRGDYPNNQYWINDNLVCAHGNNVSSVPGKTAGNAVKDARATMIMGHSHRLEMASKTIYARRGDITYRAISLGCMCKIGGKTPGTKEKQNWQNALGVVKYKEGNSIFEIHPLFIQHGKMIWNNKVFEGESTLEQLIKDIDWKQFNLDSNELR